MWDLKFTLSQNNVQYITFFLRVSEDVRREAEKMLRAISSPFLVRIMGIIDEPQCLSIVMEYFENGNKSEINHFVLIIQ